MRIGKCPDCGTELFKLTQYMGRYEVKYCPICKTYKGEVGRKLISKEAKLNFDHIAYPEIEKLCPDDIATFLTYLSDSEVSILECILKNRGGTSVDAIGGFTVSAEGISVELNTLQELVAFAKGILFLKDVDGKFQEKENRNL